MYSIFDSLNLVLLHISFTRSVASLVKEFLVQEKCTMLMKMRSQLETDLVINVKACLQSNIAWRRPLGVETLHNEVLCIRRMIKLFSHKYLSLTYPYNIRPERQVARGLDYQKQSCDWDRQWVSSRKVGWKVSMMRFTGWNGARVFSDKVAGRLCYAASLLEGARCLPTCYELI